MTCSSPAGVSSSRCRLARSNGGGLLPSLREHYTRFNATTKQSAIEMTMNVRQQSLGHHNIWLHQRPTSISLERDFWELFRLRVMEHGSTVGELLAHIDRTMRLLPDKGPKYDRTISLSAAVRLYVLRSLMEENEQLRASLRAAGALRSYPTGHYPAWRPAHDSALPHHRCAH